MGRPAVVPPAGRGMWVGCAPLSGRWGEGGALSPNAPREVWPARRSSPTLGTLGEVGMDREDSIPTGRWAAQRAATAGKGRGRRVGGRRPSCECQ